MKATDFYDRQKRKLKGKNLEKVKTLEGSIQADPKDGIGHPERLKKQRDRGLLQGNENLWSRKIDGKNRLVYEIDEDKKEVTLHRCWGHYGDK